MARGKKSPSSPLSVLSLLALSLQLFIPAADVHGITFTCPPQEGSILLKHDAFENPSPSPGASQMVSLTTTKQIGDVCILSLLVPDGPVPITRSFDGRLWEKKAGSMFANSIPEPLCDQTVDGQKEGELCKIELLVDQATLGPNGENKYILTTTHYEGTRE